MGDAADYLTEQGMDSLAMHDAGMCDGPCQYCDAEEPPKCLAKAAIVGFPGDCQITITTKSKRDLSVIYSWLNEMRRIQSR